MPNASKFAVTNSFDVKVEPLGLGSTVLVIPSLGAFNNSTHTVNVGPAPGQCCNPQCTVTAMVDAGFVIAESDKSDNQDSRAD